MTRRCPLSRSEISSCDDIERDAHSSSGKLTNADVAPSLALAPRAIDPNLVNAKVARRRFGDRTPSRANFRCRRRSLGAPSRQQLAPAMTIVGTLVFRCSIGHVMPRRPEPKRDICRRRKKSVCARTMRTRSIMLHRFLAGSSRARFTVRQRDREPRGSGSCFRRYLDPRRLSRNAERVSLEN